MSFRVRLILVMVMVLFMFALHNSFWWWDWDAKAPLLFAFMPFSFYYHVFYSILACLVIYLVIKLAWPEPPEELFSDTGAQLNEGNSNSTVSTSSKKGEGLD